ncbi:MAG TPA: arsenate reductase ArsC [Sphaerochaeta sp.]|nr:arsenate reductase ArsC [Sphaerochaeta sp.]
MTNSKPKVAFICTHNSCRSQIAEALGRRFHSEVFTSYSAGTEIKPAINADAVRLVKTLFGIDMNKAQKPKLLAQLPPVDVVILMGCNVQCPSLACKHREDWQLEDPSGKEDAAFVETIRSITEKLEGLSDRIARGLLL